MDEFDLLISMEGEAEKQGKQEAWEQFKEQYLKNKAIQDGFFYSNELHYYKNFLQLLQKTQINELQKKKVEKLIQSIDKKLKEEKPDIENLTLLRQKFKNLMKQLKLKTDDPNQEAFQLINNVN